LNTASPLAAAPIDEVVVDPPAPAVGGALLPAATVVSVDGADVPPAVDVEGAVEVPAPPVVEGVDGEVEVEGVEEVEAVEEVDDFPLPYDEEVEDEGLVDAVEPGSFLPHAASPAASASTSASFIMDVSRAEDGLAFWNPRPAGPRETLSRTRMRMRPTWSWAPCSAARRSGVDARQQLAEAGGRVDAGIHPERERGEGCEGQQGNEEVAGHGLAFRKEVDLSSTALL
jgi:hypothetical protein